MADFAGVLVELPGGGPDRIYLPGPDAPGVSTYTASVDGSWLTIHAICPAGSGYVAGRFSMFHILGYHPI